MRRTVPALLLATLLLPLSAALPLAGVTPSPPQGLVAAGGIGRIDLSWSPPSDPGAGVRGYGVYRDGALRATVAANVTSFSDVGLGASETHRYVVRANGVVLSSAPSNEVNVTTSATPPAPTDLAARPGVRSVTLRWSAPPADSFNVYRDGALVGSAANATFVDGGLEDATVYAYAVSAVKAGVEGARSSPVSVRTLDSPDAPRNLTARGVEGGIVLSWTRPASHPANNATNATTTYRVYADVGGWTLVGETAATTFEDRPLAAGTTRTYRVTAVTPGGESAPSHEATATAIAKPSAPQDLVATPTNLSIRLTWNAPADDGASPLRGYNVHLVNANGTRSLLGQTNATRRSFDDHAAPPGAARTYVVTAVNAAGEGPASNEATATRAGSAYAAGSVGPRTWSPRVVLSFELRA